MKLLNYLILGLMIYAGFRGGRSFRRCKGPKERAFLVRMGAAYIVVGVVFVTGFLFSTNKARALMLLPVLFVGLSGWKFMLNVREKVRREEAGAADFERMKRVN
jgi:hypothetical protein